eukprot:2051406-Lingulodinium_polyedra.AAC.1
MQLGTYVPRRGAGASPQFSAPGGRIINASVASKSGPRQRRCVANVCAPMRAYAQRMQMHDAEARAYSAACFSGGFDR